jgi:hypothetical protein
MLPTLWIHTRTLIYQLTLNGKFSISKNFLKLINSLIIFLFDMCNLNKIVLQILKMIRIFLLDFIFLLYFNVLC